MPHAPDHRAVGVVDSHRAWHANVIENFYPVSLTSTEFSQLTKCAGAPFPKATGSSLLTAQQQAMTPEYLELPRRTLWHRRSRDLFSHKRTYNAARPRALARAGLLLAALQSLLLRPGHIGSSIMRKGR